MSFWTIWDGFGSTLGAFGGAFWEDVGRYWGSFWEVFGVVASSLQTPWHTPLPVNLHQKTFAAPHPFGTVRNAAAAT